jgi:hypothetical protein
LPPQPGFFGCWSTSFNLNGLPPAEFAINYPACFKECRGVDVVLTGRQIAELSAPKKRLFPIIETRRHAMQIF